MMKDYLRNWNIMRFIRLALGIAIIIQGVQASEWMFIVLGAMFSLMPIFNLGCSSGNCSIPKDKSIAIDDDVIFEEVK
ncbi:MAG TPA: hypothetical protein VLZ75_02085 [Chitinophagales bacterium]|nr:hypothetical protein [Chitinophagales bacterium]